MRFDASQPPRVRSSRGLGIALEVYMKVRLPAAAVVVFVPAPSPRRLPATRKNHRKCPG